MYIKSFLNPRFNIFPILFSALCIGANLEAAGSAIVVAQVTHTGKINLIDPSTGSVTNIFSNSSYAFNGAAYDPASGLIIMTTVTSPATGATQADGFFYSFNPLTPNVAPVKLGSTGLPANDPIGFVGGTISNSNYYSYSNTSTNSLTTFTVGDILSSTETGPPPSSTSTALNITGTNNFSPNGGDMIVDNQGRVWIYSARFGGNLLRYDSIVDAFNNQPPVIFDTPFGSFGITYDSNTDTLYGLTGTIASGGGSPQVHNNFYQISITEPSTPGTRGTATFDIIATNSEFGIQGDLTAGFAIPEPSTGALTLVALIGALGRRSRSKK